MGWFREKNEFVMLLIACFSTDRERIDNIEREGEGERERERER